MNNSIYNFLYDSVVNTYLIEHCGLRPTSGEQYGMVGKLVQTLGAQAPRLADIDPSKS